MLQGPLALLAFAACPHLVADSRQLSLNEAVNIGQKPLPNGSYCLRKQELGRQQGSTCKCTREVEVHLEQVRTLAFNAGTLQPFMRSLQEDCLMVICRL